MPTLAVKLWRRLFPFRCEWCSFKSRTPQGIGKHRKRCAHGHSFRWDGARWVLDPKETA